MNHEEAIEQMAKEREVDTATINALLCVIPQQCKADSCKRYTELRAEDPKPAAPLSTYVEPLCPGKIILVLPVDAEARNQYPMFDGLFGYFASALAEVAKLSFIANEQHNPGEPMHWARDKSTDHKNKIIKHLLDAEAMDTDGTLHATKLAWRSLALLQEILEKRGAPVPPNAY